MRQPLSGRQSRFHGGAGSTSSRTTRLSRAVCFKDPFRSHDERVEKPIASLSSPVAGLRPEDFFVDRMDDSDAGRPEAGPITSRSTDARSPTATRVPPWVYEWLAVLLVAVGLAFAVRAYVFQTYFIPSPSMDTLLIGDRILVDKLSYRLHAVGQGQHRRLRHACQGSGRSGHQGSGQAGHRPAR